MNLLRRCLAAMVLLALPVQLAAATPKDWTKAAVRTPAGGFVMGNPAARVKLTEYLSLTCPHCAAFEGEGIPPLMTKYVRTGLVSYEVRHALRDGFDLAGSLLARCDGPVHFFAVLPKVYAEQANWFAKAQAWSQNAQADNLPPDQLLPKVARGAGFDALMGIPAGRIDACLTNQAEQKLLTDMANAAWKLPDFPGTPAFAINGRLRPEVRSWADLDAALVTALHQRPSPGKTKRK